MANVHVYNGTDFKEIEGSSEDTKHFYYLLYKLNDASHLFSKAKTIDALYKVAVETATRLLDLDRLGILLIDPLQKIISGSWGCDEKGGIRSEHDLCSSIDTEFRDILRNIENRGKVCIWDNHPLYEFDDADRDVVVIGLGWAGAVAIWQDDLLIGWIACDNLLNHRPFKPYITHILRLFSANLCGYRDQLIAQQKIAELNQQLEFKVKQRTRQLAEMQNALELANIDLEIRIRVRTQSLKLKNNQLEIAIKKLNCSENQLSSVQAHKAIKDLVVGTALEINAPLKTAYQQANELPNLLDSLSTAMIADDKISSEKILQQCHNLSKKLQSNVNNTNTIALEFDRLSMIDVESIPTQEVVLIEWFNNTIAAMKNSEATIKSLSIEVKFNTSMDSVILHSEILMQVFKELLLYAGLQLKAEQQGKVLINLNIINGALFATVENNGLKMNQDLQQSLLSHFTTAEIPIESKASGLNVVFNLVHSLLKGSLSYFDSKLGGAGFLIKCPIKLTEKNLQAQQERMKHPIMQRVK